MEQGTMHCRRVHGSYGMQPGECAGRHNNHGGNVNGYVLQEYVHRPHAKYDNAVCQQMGIDGYGTAADYYQYG